MWRRVLLDANHQYARDADGEMQSIGDRTDLEASEAAEVNRPPVGTHDTSDVPELPDAAVAGAERGDGTTDD